MSTMITVTWQWEITDDEERFCADAHANETINNEYLHLWSRRVLDTDMLARARNRKDYRDSIAHSVLSDLMWTMYEKLEATE